MLSKILPQDFVVEVTIPYFAGHTVMHDYLVGTHIGVIVDVVIPHATTFVDILPFGLTDSARSPRSTYIASH